MPKMIDSDEDCSPEMDLGQRKPGPKSKKATAEGLAALPPKQPRNRQIIVGGKEETLSSRPAGRAPSSASRGRDTPLPPPSSSSSSGGHRVPSGSGLPPSGITSRKRPQQKLTPQQVQRITIADSDEEDEEEQFNNNVQRNGGGYRSDMDGFTDDESDGTGVQISEMLNRLGNELRGRIKAKRRRIQECFQSVKESPNAILETLQNHSLERGKVVQKFQQKSGEIASKVQEVFEAQKETEDKLSKMMLAVKTHFDTMKESLNSCVTGLKEIIKQFDQESSEMQGNQDEDTRMQLAKINAELTALQKRMCREGGKEEAESIRHTLNLS